MSHFLYVVHVLSVAIRHTTNFQLCPHEDHTLRFRRRLTNLEIKKSRKQKRNNDKKETQRDGNPE